jgi:hypothetical protein
MNPPLQMSQSAPYPHELRDLVRSCVYKPGWTFSLGRVDRGQDSIGLTMTIRVTNPDSYDPTRYQSVLHYFIVPAASYNRRSWRRWLFERIRDVETHEACEFFQVDGERPYAPLHGPGNDPYFVYELASAEDVDTNFRGERVRGDQPEVWA